ncbi:MAG: glycosyltransferase [Myxococcota bacterium]|nr:glycosyltransferase [Myxococcota bacterium]
MRLLFTFVGGIGHFEPLVPLARAASEAGHRVAFACPPSMAEAVATAGFDALAVGSQASPAPRRTPLRPLDREREERDLRERFARRAARHRAPRIVSLCESWEPDVVVRDETDFGAALAAECLGLPFATVLVIAAGGFVRAEVVGPPLEELRAELGLAPDPDLEMPSRYLVLSPAPPGYRDPADPLPPTAHAFRPEAAAAAGGRFASWTPARTGRPLVYFTLGTVFPLESGDLFARVLAGLRELPVDVIATVGPDLDPRELGPQPSHVRVETFVPQSAVLPHCELVVSHGGSGSVIGALAHGLPSVLVPIGADQPGNARRCVALGVARELDAISLTPEEVRAATAAVLDDPSYRRHAETLRHEIEALPGARHAVGLLERLAREKRPIRRT